MSGTNWRNSPSKPGELDIFLVLTLFPTFPFQKLGKPTPFKAIFLNRSCIGLASKKFRFGRLKTVVSVGICE